MSDFSALQVKLSQLASGQSSLGEIEKLLARCWDQISGSGDQGMEGWKLLDRMDKVSWKPPILTFSIERHGAMVMGSSRAEIHTWTVDLKHRTASIIDIRKTQKEAADARLDTRVLATEVAEIICQRLDDPRLLWRDSNNVVVKLGEIITETNRQTTASRRKRFRGQLVEILRGKGWIRLGTGSQLSFVPENPENGR